MALLSFLNRKSAPEIRNIPAVPQTYPLTDKSILEWIRKGECGSVTEEQAFSVPAIDAGVSLISSTISSLPFHLFTKKADGSKDRPGAKDPLSKLISETVNTNYLTSSAWLRWVVTRLLIEGRCITFIERNAAGRAMNLWPQNLADIKVEMINGQVRYKRETDGAIFDAGEILDFIMRPGSEPYSHRSPLVNHADTINLWLKIQMYGTALFANGGVSPHIATIRAASPEQFSRIRDELNKRIKQDKADGLPLTTIPGGTGGSGDVDIKILGHDPQKQQLLETRQWLVVEFARMLNVHPAMIQDHSKSTFSNTEQADLQYSKHTCAPICNLIETEMNAKLFSDRNRSSFVEFNMDGLQRGDLASRYTAYGQGVQNGFLTPDEIRKKENLPNKGGSADKLHIQGATVPLDSQPTMAEPVDK